VQGYKTRNFLPCEQVNTQLYSTREKEELHQLVAVMIAYNMTYLQERSQDGQYNYVLEPWVVQTDKCNIVYCFILALKVYKVNLGNNEHKIQLPSLFSRQDYA